MQPSMFNVRVPLEDCDEVFLMNTFTDAQLIVSRDVSDLLDRLGNDGFSPVPSHALSPALSSAVMSSSLTKPSLTRLKPSLPPLVFW